MLPRGLRCRVIILQWGKYQAKITSFILFPCRETEVSLRKHCHKRHCSVAILMVGTAQQYKTHSKTVAFERLLLWVLLFWHCYLGSMPDANVKINFNPCGALAVTSIVPLWCMTAFFTMAKPKPVPPIFLLLPLSIR